jgi:toxin ParE1/3/4
MEYKVHFIYESQEDLWDIYKYVSYSDSIEKAEYLIQKLEETCSNLSESPNRGHIPPELAKIGVMEYKEVHFKPYRIIYEISEKDVYIHSILDGRRELQELLEKRVIR